MGAWREGFNKVDERAAITFGSWDELHKWHDSCAENGDRDNACPLIEKLFVIGCYQQYRKHELMETVRPIYTDGKGGMRFEIVGEVQTDDSDFDLCSLPMWFVNAGGETMPMFPEELFVNY